METLETVKITAEGPEGWVIKSKARDHTLIIDQPEAMGGTDTGPTPLEYTLIALGGCLVAIAKIVAGQKKINLRKVNVEISSEINLAVLRGQEKDDRAGFRSFNAKVRVDADLTDEEKQEFVNEVSRRCPVRDNLANTTPVNLTLVK